jgi:hypothetical protein
VARVATEGGRARARAGAARETPPLDGQVAISRLLWLFPAGRRAIAGLLSGGNDLMNWDAHALSNAPMHLPMQGQKTGLQVAEENRTSATEPADSRENRGRAGTSGDQRGPDWPIPLFRTSLRS